jgi:hypothetical protein
LGKGKNQEDSTKDLCDRNGFSLSNCKANEQIFQN